MDNLQFYTIVCENRDGQRINEWAIVNLLRTWSFTGFHEPVSGIIRSDGFIYWTSLQQDMTELSQLFPSYRFSVFAESRHLEEHHCWYFTSGQQVGGGRVQVVYPDPPWKE